MLNSIYSKLSEIWNLIVWRIVSIRSSLRGNKSTALIIDSNKKFLICGNGPSTADVDFDLYTNEGYELVCVNFFATKDERFWKKKPKYYCCVDPGIFESPETSNIGTAVRDLLDALERVDWDMNFICRADSRVALKNPHINIIRLNKNIYEWPNNKSKKRAINLYSKNKATCGYQNVIIAALFYCIGIRAKDILLTGIEMDFHKELLVDQDNIVYRECRHFYGVEYLNLIDRGEINKGELYKYFYFYYKTLYQFYIMSIYAKNTGVNVTNLCCNSFVDVFEKKK